MLENLSIFNCEFSESTSQLIFDTISDLENYNSFLLEPIRYDHVLRLLNLIKYSIIFSENQNNILYQTYLSRKMLS